jgi:hypothetical protein
MTDAREHASAWRRPILAGLLVLTVVVGLRGITTPASVMLGGDMARYIMNGVFLYDLAGDGGAWSYDELASYAERYYARYPALSLGHHPPVPYFTLVPFFAVFGVSLVAARLAALCWFVLAAGGLYALTKRLLDWRAASWATALFVTNLMVMRAGQYVLSEMPMVALELVAANLLLRACDTRRWTHFGWFVVAVAASLYAKQLAILVVPAYAVILLTKLGWRIVLRRSFVMTAAAAAVLAVPIAAMTVGMAPANLGLAFANAQHLVHGTRGYGVTELLQTIVSSHLTMPALVATVAGAAWLVGRRSLAGAAGLTWVLFAIAGSVVLAGRIEPARYAFSALPGYCLLAAGLAGATGPWLRRAGVTALAATLAWQAWTNRDVYPSGAGGYEDAARYVITNSKPPVILYDGAFDTGYFVFFMRKHDTGGRHAVFRADKVLPLWGLDAEAQAEAIDHVLQQYGVQFIVVETRASGPPTLETLHHVLRTDRFIERYRVPVVSTALPGVDLIVYEYRDARPPDYDAELHIGLPLSNRDIALRLRDVVPPERAAR